MNTTKSIVALCVAVSVVSATSREANAACNSFPSAQQVSSGGGPLSQSPTAEKVSKANQQARARASAPLLYQATLGRIDGLDFAPGSTVFAAADFTCGGPSFAVPEAARPAFKAMWLDKLVAVVLFQREGSAQKLARVYTHERGRGHSDGQLCGLRKAFAGTAIHPLDDCPQTTMKTVATGRDKASLGIPMPTERELLAAATTSLDRPTSAPFAFTLMAMTPPKSAAALADIAGKIAAAGCEQSCKDFVTPAAAGGAICADKVISIGASRLGGRVVYLDEGFPDCDGTLQVKVKGPTNKFLELCEPETNGVGPCFAAPPEDSLYMRQDSCGRLHIPFEWDGVFDKDPVVLAGQSATSRKTEADENRIWIPGREFVGSTPTASGNDQLPDVDWRKPDITVWFPTSTEFGLKGVVDKLEPSTIHVFPNYEVRVLCKEPSTSGVPEACERVDHGVNASTPNCACTDRYDAGCTCEAIEPGRYFACVGGNRAGMPCTRHDHCNNKDGTEGGLCNGQPECRAPDSVFKVSSDGQKGALCGTDADCKNDPNGLTQCGYRLFNLSAQQDTAKDKEIRLERRLKRGGQKRRGTCVNDAARSCDNIDKASDPKGCQSGDCRGYRLVVAP